MRDRRLTHERILGILCAAALLCAPGATPMHPGTAAAQNLPAQPSDTITRGLRLFLDCSSVSGCDFDYLRTELNWIDYVRDRTVSQVHVIATSLKTASGGVEVTLKFIGLHEFAGMDDEVRYTTPQGATKDEERREFSRVLTVGLARYLLRTRYRTNLVLSYTPPTGPTSAPKHTRDPWDFWVFRLGVDANLSGESQSSSREVSGEVSASRTTEQWKIRVGVNGTNNRGSYQLTDSTTYVATSRKYSSSMLLARSLGNHFSAGASLSARSSTHSNLDLRARAAPVLEYDFFKYDQYSQRRLVLSYSIGGDRFVYTDTTIYNKLKETLLDQSVALSFAATEPWGEPYLGISGSHFLSDFHKNHLSIYTGISVRIVKGLELNLNGYYSRVRDQISLAKADLSDAEILLQLRQLRTTYTYSANIGLGYTFGSVFNNVVNPRLEGEAAKAP